MIYFSGCFKLNRGLQATDRRVWSFSVFFQVIGTRFTNYTVFYPFCRCKKGFFAIISKTVEDSDLKLWSAPHNAVIAVILVGLLRSLSQKIAEVWPIEIWPYAWVKKGVKIRFPLGIFWRTFFWWFYGLSTTDRRLYIHSICQLRCSMAKFTKTIFYPFRACKKGVFRDFLENGRR